MSDARPICHVTSLGIYNLCTTEILTNRRHVAPDEALRVARHLYLFLPCLKELVLHYPDQIPLSHHLTNRESSECLCALDTVRCLQVALCKQYTYVCLVDKGCTHPCRSAAACVGAAFGQRAAKYTEFKRSRTEEGQGRLPKEDRRRRSPVADAEITTPGALLNPPCACQRICAIRV